MKASATAKFVVMLVALTLCLSGFAQSGRRTQNVPVEKPKPAEAEKEKAPGEAKKEEAKKEEAKKPEPSPDPDAIKLDATLITVPVIASDRSGLYIPDLKASEFTVYEDGVQQEVAYFAKVSEPFHVILMLDTSASSTEKMSQIRNAAIAFIEQLQPADRIKVISFDDVVHDLTGFTNDRAVLRDAINSIAPGQGTHLYDAFHHAMLGLANVRRDRRAIVLFTDGVDNRSDATTYDANLREVEESGVIVYPIRYDTRAEVEALVRGQQNGRLPNIGDIIKKRLPPNTPPTNPGGGNPIPTPPQTLPPVIVNRPRTNPYPNDPTSPRGRPDDPSRPDYDPRYPSDPGGGRGKDSISMELDRMYKTADNYLTDLAQKSGGKLHRADTLFSLPDTFARIAAELRTQYALGYYPANPVKDGKYRKIQVKVSRKNTVIRARPGYQ